MRRALLSVSDKTGLVDFARGLRGLGFQLYSTGGTLQALVAGEIPAAPVSALTGFPEILDGRVKTLHPGVHAGLLARRGDPAHAQALAEHGLVPLDLLAVNLYPFAATAALPGAGFAEVVEQIDVGGPAMIRAAAKNHPDVLVVTRPEAYPEVLAALTAGEAGRDLRRRLAADAFAHTAAYDALIAGWLREQDGGGFPAELALGGKLVHALRYGENPHQQAAFYRLDAERGGLAAGEQLQGPELSFNNLQDAAAGGQLVAEFERPAVAVVKHTNPCGLALAEELATAAEKALDCDRVAAYGGVMAVNRPLDLATVERIGGLFLEVLVAPAVEPAARAALGRKAKLRLLVVPPLTQPDAWEVRSIAGGLLVQSPDRLGFDRQVCRIVSSRQPTPGEWSQLELAWLTAKHVKSNAIVLARDDAAVGVGAGQMSRVEAVLLAVSRAGDRARGSVLASDAFFPFPDGVEAAARAGVTAVIQPGGSVRDAEVLAAAEAAGLAMVTTGSRHFRH